MSGWKKSLTGYANETVIGKYKFVGKDLGKMSKSAVDSEYLSDVWTRINGTIVEQGINKKDIAKRCGFDRKILSSYSNLNLIYFARICEELNVSADFFLFGLDKAKEKTVTLATVLCFDLSLMPLSPALFRPRTAGRQVFCPWRGPSPCPPAGGWCFPPTV